MDKTRSAALETALRAWEGPPDAASKDETNQRTRAFTLLIRAIAAGRSVSRQEFAAELAIPEGSAEGVFAGLQASGVEFDEAGRLVGAALTPHETPHRISFDGKNLFAWCALDTLFIPGLVGETAEIESTCPTSGDAIRLTVSPERVEACDPAETWLSVFLPGGSSRQLGPASPT